MAPWTLTAASVAASLVVFSALPAIGHAADLNGAPPGRMYEPIAPRLDIERWTGFYLGAGVADSFGSTRFRNTPATGDIADRGWLGFVYAGYNWQIGRAVLGVEADVGSGSPKGSTTIGGSLANFDTKVEGSLRARAGFLVTPAFLVYGTGGFAWSNADLAINGSTMHQTFTGYQVGLGSELMLQQNWTLRLEYL